jgi:hypothetical protein
MKALHFRMERGIIYTFLLVTLHKNVIDFGVIFKLKASKIAF